MHVHGRHFKKNKLEMKINDLFSMCFIYNDRKWSLDFMQIVFKITSDFEYGILKQFL